MKQRPILFSTPMVQAILDGRKTMTRRIMKPQPWVFSQPDNGIEDPAHEEWNWPIPKSEFKGEAIGMISHPSAFYKYCPYGQPGDVLWVREGFAPFVGMIRQPRDYKYKADNNALHKDVKWKPSIHMPKSACRLFLEVASVKVERLQDITESDAIAEGIESDPLGPVEIHDHEELFYKNYQFPESKFRYVDAKKSFASLWMSIHGSESWNQNPWVWVIEFKRNEWPQL